MSIMQRIQHRVQQANSLVCVGLDPDLVHLPRHTDLANTIFNFNRRIIDAVHDYVLAFKPNISFYEAAGIDGMKALQQTADYLHEHHPDIITICDAKRGEIANSSRGYVRGIFDIMGFDAVTLSPYVGQDGLSPFLEREDKLSIILCRMSDAGANEFQTLSVDGHPLWYRVAERVTQTWNTRQNCALVMGATFPEAMAQLRQLDAHIPLLVPGIGSQGGSIEASVRMGQSADGAGLFLSASRSIIYADDPAQAARQLRDESNRYRIK